MVMLGLVRIMQEETGAGFVQPEEEQAEGELNCCLQVPSSFKEDRLFLERDRERVIGNSTSCNKGISD